ncbi:cilia- and flagella-associated protein 44-like isoform X2 [Lineus longissimus]|uniref:cilia- and flagella-associated protein 44-like isoform X2 n=1 Tax=Lineus longissimus TaxID=88925 RepID=UPI00315CD7FC
MSPELQQPGKQAKADDVQLPDIQDTGNQRTVTPPGREGGQRTAGPPAGAPVTPGPKQAQEDKCDSSIMSADQMVGDDPRGQDAVDSAGKPYDQDQKSTGGSIDWHSQKDGSCDGESQNLTAAEHSDEELRYRTVGGEKDVLQQSPSLPLISSKPTRAAFSTTDKAGMETKTPLMDRQQEARIVPQESKGGTSGEDKKSVGVEEAAAMVEVQETVADATQEAVDVPQDVADADGAPGQVTEHQTVQGEEATEEPSAEEAAADVQGEAVEDEAADATEAEVDADATPATEEEAGETGEPPAESEAVSGGQQEEETAGQGEAEMVSADVEEQDTEGEAAEGEQQAVEPQTEGEGAEQQTTEAAQDHVEMTEATEDQAETAEATEDQVEGTEDQVEATEDQAEATEDQVEGTEDQVEATEDQAEATEDQVEGTEDQAEATEDQAEATEDQVEATEDQVEVTEDQVEVTAEQGETVESAGAQVEATEDQGETAEGDAQQETAETGQAEEEAGTRSKPSSPTQQAEGDKEAGEGGEGETDAQQEGETGEQEVAADAQHDEEKSDPEKGAAEVTEKADTEKGEKELVQEQTEGGEQAPAEGEQATAESDQAKAEGEQAEVAREAGQTPGGESEEEETPRPDEEEDIDADTGIKKIEEEDRIPEDFYYNYEEHMSKAVISEESGLPQDMLTLDHSFGYDCQKRSNLHLLDENTVSFVAGNMVQILNLKTKEQTYIRSTSGGSIGAIAVHPSRQFFAVAEKGECPNINVYAYPSLKLYRILRGGTESAYAFVDFSPDGKLLASVGMAPDFMLTIWNWRQEAIVLRSKAFSQDVFRVSFSTELEGQLTSSGTGHIRFWKMAHTFTGLKLQGQIGKFGKTEISDIEGYVELPDGKVLSGSEWGNLLLWEGGLIKVEIGRKNKKPCHNGVIQQIVMDEGELMTVGIDGCIRVWDFESIDTADVTDDSPIFEMEPMNELNVGTGDVRLKSIIKSVDADEPTLWYAQDAYGGIWKLDLSFSHTSLAPEKLMSYHAGAISACDTSPTSHLVATCGADQSVRVYDYLSKNLLSEAKYNAGGTSLLWAPQIVDPKGSTIISGYEDGVVRVLRFHRKSEEDTGKKVKDEASAIILFQAFKPHTHKVSALAIDSRGEVLATGSDDCTVFFMTVGNEQEEFYNPIGFIKVAAPVTHMQWSPSKFDRNTLLVFMANGQVTEIECPDLDNLDSSKTYQIRGVHKRDYKFASVKSKLRHEEELERKAKEEEERKAKEEEERRKRIERGLETESEQGDEEEEEKKKEEEEWSPFIPEEPSPILHGFYGKEEGSFWLSMGGFDAGYLYEGKFTDEPAESPAEPPAEVAEEEPIQSIPVADSADIPITCIKFSTSGRQVIMGLENGSVRIQPIEPEDMNDLSTIGPHWTLPMHDNQYGHVSSLALSHDNKYLFTVGADGNFFTYQVIDDAQLEERIKQEKAKLPSARRDLEERHVDDIDDMNAYSIEDARQKAEYDRMMKVADEKKQNVRKTISQLRLQFKKLVESNDELPRNLQLLRMEFEMDPEIKKELERQTHDKIALVGKEMAWEAEKCRIALEKLRQRFKDVVECERIVLKCFQSPHEVCSFRASNLSDEFYNLKAEMERRRTTFMSRDEVSRDPTKDLLRGQSGMMGGDDKSQTKDDGADLKVKTTLKGSMGERITKALNKVEEKKRKRAQRRAQWNELYGSKPDDNYEDPADVAAIREAQENMGDYKLKTADDYVVPDHLRMNAEKARNRLLILKDLIHQHKYDFNQKFLALRDKKIQIIEEIKEIVIKLTKVQKKLSAEFTKPLPHIPEMHKDEVPERKLEYTKEMLLRFKKEMEEKTLQALKGPDTGFGGAGTFAPKKTSVMEAPTKQGTALSTILGDASVEEEGAPTQEVELTSLEIKLRKVEQIKLKYEQESLLDRVSNLLQTFDAELHVLRHEKFKLDVIMKNADLRHVTLFEELVLLKEFEKRENVLAAKVEGKQQEKMDMQAKVVDCQQKLDVKRKDIEKYQELEKNLTATFLQTLGDNNKFAEYLTKVFKKKIKRAKKKTTEGEDSDDESDEESDDESDWSDEDEESDSEAGGYDLDVCPPQCEQSLYDNTCQLREKRLDIEEALSEEKKINEALKKELESLQKRAKVIDSNLRTAEGDLEAFQLEKQQKLNELDVVVTLKLHQIQHIINGVLPQDLTTCLVFEAPGVVHLQRRIKELEHEKNLQKKQQKEAKKKHVQLIKDRKLFEKRIGEMEEQCNQMMLLKFGRIVDLEKLETVTVNRQLEELKEKLRQSETECAAEMVLWEEKIERRKDRITDLIRENTNRLEQLNMLLGEKKDYEGELDSRQKNLGTEFSGSRKADIHERQRLIQLVQLQAQEIEALKDEITLLSHKGGHILPPAQPPLPGAQRQMTQ